MTLPEDEPDRPWLDAGPPQQQDGSLQYQNRTAVSVVLEKARGDVENRTWSVAVVDSVTDCIEAHSTGAFAAALDSTALRESREEECEIAEVHTKTTQHLLHWPKATKRLLLH